MTLGYGDNAQADRLRNPPVSQRRMPASIPRDGGKGTTLAKETYEKMNALQFASLSNGGRRFAMYDQVLVSVFLGAACLVVYLEFLRETAVPEKVKWALGGKPR
jgi:hypothetical protein